MASRRLEDLDEAARTLAVRFLKRCAETGLDVLIYCTTRTMEEQARLWRVGRAPGVIERAIRRLASAGKGWIASLIDRVGPQSGKRIVTYTLPGESAHNHGFAFDAVPLRDGKPAWDDDELLAKMGALGKEVGLSWAGDWKRFRESVHFELPDWRERVKDLP